MLPAPRPRIADLLTPEQLDQLAQEIDAALSQTGYFEVTLQFNKMQLRYIRTSVSKAATRGEGSKAREKD